MADKFVNLGASGPIEKEFAVVSSGAADAGRGLGLDAQGRIDASVLPVGVGADTYTGVAAEALVAGAKVYVKSNGEIANASAAVGGNPADGFVLLASSAAAAATIHFEGRNTSKTGLTVGSTYFLSDVTPGAIITTAPVGAGKLYQVVGKAVSSTTMTTEFSTAVIRA